MLNEFQTGKTLATVRAELADRISAEASARMEIEQLTKRLATNEKELDDEA